MGDALGDLWPVLADGEVGELASSRRIQELHMGNGGIDELCVRGHERRSDRHHGESGASTAQPEGRDTERCGGARGNRAGDRVGHLTGRVVRQQREQCVGIDARANGTGDGRCRQIPDARPRPPP